MCPSNGNRGLRCWGICNSKPSQIIIINSALLLLMHFNHLSICLCTEHRSICGPTVCYKAAVGILLSKLLLLHYSIRNVTVCGGAPTTCTHLSERLASFLVIQKNKTLKEDDKQRNKVPLFYIVHTFTQTRTHTVTRTGLWPQSKQTLPLAAHMQTTHSKKVYTHLSQFVRIRVNWSTECLGLAWFVQGVKKQ